MDAAALETEGAQAFVVKVELRIQCEYPLAHLLCIQRFDDRLVHVDIDDMRLKSRRVVIVLAFVCY